jgi:hypothetical protein
MAMHTRKTLDRQPGCAPEIRAEGNSVTFRLQVLGVKGARLLIRCDPNGDVRASICAADE